MTQTHKPSRGEIISALNRMASATDERDHYSFCRLDASWCRAAIEMLIRDYEAQQATPALSSPHAKGEA